MWIQMQLEVMDVIQLEDNRKYIVANTSLVNNIKYYLLINDELETDMIIGYIDKKELVVVDDPEEYSKILLTFDYDKIINQFNDLFSNEFLYKIKNTFFDVFSFSNGAACGNRTHAYQSHNLAC